MKTKMMRTLLALTIMGLAVALNTKF